MPHQFQLSVQILLLPIDRLPLKVFKIEPLFLPVVGLFQLPFLDLFQVVLQIILVELLRLDELVLCLGIREGKDTLRSSSGKGKSLRLPRFSFTFLILSIRSL
jgi:hypothetical protein